MGALGEMGDTSIQKRSLYSVEIDEDHCKGCLLCVFICNKHGGKVLKESGEKTVLGGALPTLDGECIGCRWCERFCPDFAISVEEEAAC